MRQVLHVFNIFHFSAVQRSCVNWSEGSACPSPGGAIFACVAGLDLENSPTQLAVLAPFLPGFLAPHNKAPPGGRICCTGKKTNTHRHPTGGRLERASFTRPGSTVGSSGELLRVAKTCSCHKPQCALRTAQDSMLKNYTLRPFVLGDFQ